MHRIDGAGATTQNLFTEGDPTQGVPATTVTGAWLNAVQEEVANVIEGAGMTLAKGDNTQLHAAIVELIAANQQTGFETGDVKLTMASTAPTGWVMCNDGSIGDAESGATARAHADTEDLFTLLWSNVADGYAPVSGGRGASAAADFAAGKTIGLTRMLGRALGIAGSGASLTARSLGQYLGAETHQLVTGEMPSHGHGVNDPGHHHTINGGAQFITNSPGGGVPGGAQFAGNPNTDNSATGISIQSAGGGGAHNNMQPTAFLNAMVKL